MFVRALIAAALLAVPLTAAAQTRDAEPFTLASLGLKGQLVYKNFSYVSETPRDDRLVYHGRRRLTLTLATRARAPA